MTGSVARRLVSRVRFPVEDHLDVGSARDLIGRVANAPPGAVIEIDLGQARTVEPAGIAALAAGLAESGRAVVFRGLCERHVRILRYFGLDPTGGAHARDLGAP